jgi:hypothetical protein
MRRFIYFSSLPTSKGLYKIHCVTSSGILLASLAIVLWSLPWRGGSSHLEMWGTAQSSAHSQMCFEITCVQYILYKRRPGLVKDIYIQNVVGYWSSLDNGQIFVHNFSLPFKVQWLGCVHSVITFKNSALLLLSVSQSASANSISWVDQKCIVYSSN